MSQFLAPIHSWLFNKIKLSEALEAQIIDSFQMRADLTDQHFIAHLTESVGAPLGNVAIEEVIDPSNIHGWLQSRIHQTEQRTAALVSYIVGRKPSGLERLKAIYSQFGESQIDAIGLRGAVSPDLAFKKLHDILLEGMPCDRVHQVVEQSENHLRWDTYQCLHKPFYDAIDGDIAHYYALKETLIKALLSKSEPPLTYTLTKATPESNALYSHTLSMA